MRILVEVRKLVELLQDEPAWRIYIERLHDDAGLEVYDDELIRLAATDLALTLHTEIHEASRSGMMRQMIVAAWREETKKTTAATVA